MDWSEQIEANGFAIYQDVISANWLNKILEDDIWKSPRSRAGLRHAMRFGPVRDLARSSELQELACGVLGPRAFPFRATLFDKSPVANWFVAWHQDTALPLRLRIDVPGWSSWSKKEGVTYAHAPAGVLSQVVALRVHLDDSSQDNGPLRILPGTHTLGLLSDNRIRELAQQLLAVECIVPKGGVVAMRPLLVHSSSKTHSGSARRVLHIEYAASISIASPLELEIV
jgi:hypothetical protein